MRKEYDFSKAKKNPYARKLKLQSERKRLKLKKSLQDAFGAWKEKDHPELKKGTEGFVRGLRKSTRRTRSR